MLNLRIVRGPLEPGENEQILREYNRLTESAIPMDEFVRWVQHNPAGPAWHAILQTDEGRVVGHTSLLPLLTSYPDPAIIPARSEYSFTHEDFRSAPIRGYENVKRAKFMILVDELFKHGVREGWGPYYVSTRGANHPLSRRVGCKPVDFPLWECLLTLRPGDAARETPNLKPVQRAALFGIGSAQSIAWSIAGAVLPKSNGVRTESIGESAVAPTRGRLAFFEDVESLKWRYPEEQFLRYEFADAPGDYAIVKRGNPQRFLRVVQCSLQNEKSAGKLIRMLEREARAEKALGVRWPIFEDGPESAKLAGVLKRHGFLCASRVRTIMIHTKDEKFLDRNLWRFDDSHFSFDP